ncbi:hypothetical protein KL930_000800 [Ogataea haglerorum]|uniref:Transmembrane 9 superfamily member n=1 Tax=Ogataea haglerorum TaxID=1937702 RepID=A0AAN6DCC9_9ASCO|nr:uncharacterized protein KL911_003483 [Ogataea haglerorum]KAG7701770.1 hypothetical protein KL951_000226 [Ogataea haglerorum]KAG7711584.1 hypothetical protein KL914_000226 [Ogataea haglerorum]KAG7712355.1 hypothetical protein KL950_000226 [Ogataea haglerorum]KAG7722407.1 hypothetical protein KL913_000227 [Ogataea haglerorum]KAG7723489.1 hypothetical protein KL949_000539 [Ogataea haglerorum]
MATSTTWLAITALLLWPALCSALRIEKPSWKLPWGRNYYKDGDKVDLLVNTVESENTQLPYAYYRLPFVCPPTQNARPVHLSLGEVLNGDRIWQSDYHLTFGQDEPCARLCDRVITQNAIKRADELIKNEYMVEWRIDGLPGATTFLKPKTGKQNAEKYYVAGFPLGFVQNGVSYLHNHVMIVVRWHKENGNPDKKTIVGFEVYPKSVSDYHCPGASRDYANFAIVPGAKDKLVVPFTYSVYWREEVDVTYENRWKMYRTPGGAANDSKMHWFALVNSLLVVSLLSLAVSVVFFRTLNSDFRIKKDTFTEKLDSLVGSLPETGDGRKSGWRALASEVFVQPSMPLILSILGGSGVQLSLTMFGVSILCTAGMSGPNNTILTSAIATFVIAGFFSGFSGVQFYKSFTHKQVASWRTVSFLSGSLLTALILIILFILNFIIWAKDSSLALPFGTIMALILIYVLLQIPISLFGGFVSNRLDLLGLLIKRKPRIAERYREGKRAIPKQPFYNKLKFSLPLFGLFPFGIIFVELVFLFKSLWVEKLSFYYMYGFLSFTAFLLYVVVVEISILSTYLRLNSGDYYNWQWKAFVTSAGSIFIYLMGYSVYYLIFRMKVVDIVSPIIYLVYATIMDLILGVSCGAIGLLASTFFVYKIYS